METPEVDDRTRLLDAMTSGLGGWTESMVAEKLGIPLAVVQAVRGGQRALVDSPRLRSWVEGQERMGKL